MDMKCKIFIIILGLIILIFLINNIKEDFQDEEEGYDEEIDYENAGYEEETVGIEEEAAIGEEPSYTFMDNDGTEVYVYVDADGIETYFTENGDQLFYDEEGNRIEDVVELGEPSYTFDEPDGTTIFVYLDEEGTELYYDAEGNEVYYDEDGNRIENVEELGEPSYTFDDVDGTTIFVYLDEEGNELYYDAEGNEVYFDEEGNRIEDVEIEEEQIELGEAEYTFIDTDGMEVYVYLDADGNELYYDENGNEIYYDEDGNKIIEEDLGDPEYVFTDEEGNTIYAYLDKYGNEVYYDEDGNQVYYGEEEADDGLTGEETDWVLDDSNFNKLNLEDYIYEKNYYARQRRLKNEALRSSSQPPEIIPEQKEESKKIIYIERPMKIDRNAEPVPIIDERTVYVEKRVPYKPIYEYELPEKQKEKQKVTYTEKPFYVYPKKEVEEIQYPYSSEAPSSSQAPFSSEAPSLYNEEVNNIKDNYDILFTDTVPPKKEFSKFDTPEIKSTKDYIKKIVSKKKKPKEKTYNTDISNKIDDYVRFTPNGKKSNDKILAFNENN